MGRHTRLPLYGTDYPTSDGTALRDYIHVMDLADGNLAAMEHMERSAGQVQAYNLGTGRAASVREVIAAMREATGQPLPYEELDRRSGDIPELWADTDKARRELGWSANFTLSDMCRDGWAWQSAHPHGYRKAC